MLLRLILILLTTQPPSTAPTADSVLMRVGSSFNTIQISARLSTTGAQSFSGMPFSVVMDSAETYKLVMSGPFGITAAQMVATANSFVMINYLQQEVWDGDPRSPSLASASHLPIPAADLMSLMRGRVPGDAQRFIRSSASRDDNTVLFTARDTAIIEYLLIDTVQNVLRQYQSKDTAGALLLDVAFQDVKIIDGHLIPHKVLVASKDRKETATIEFIGVELNQPIEPISPPPIPSSFERRTFR